MPTIEPPQQRDEAAWRRLYYGYAAFYDTPMTDEIAATVWRWIHDPAHEVEGVIARRDGGEIVGLAHFRRMPSPLRGADIGFLDDLFVAPEARGGRIGEALIRHVCDIARDRGWSSLRWITQDGNYRARTLYDRLAVRTAWITYEAKP